MCVHVHVCAHTCIPRDQTQVLLTLGKPLPLMTSPALNALLAFSQDGAPHDALGTCTGPSEDVTHLSWSTRPPCPACTHKADPLPPAPETWNTACTNLANWVAHVNKFLNSALQAAGLCYNKLLAN